MKKNIAGKRFYCLFAAGFACALTVIVLVKPVFAEQYYKPTMDNLASMIFGMGGLDLQKVEAFSEFMKLVSCDTYMEFADKEFDWKEIHKQFLENQNNFKENTPVKYKVLTEFLVSGYSLDIMSFEVAPQSVLKKIKAVEMNYPAYSFCEKDTAVQTKLRYIPKSVVLNLEVPLSLYRIPVSSAVAEGLIDKLDRDRKTSARVVYAVIYVTVETVKKNAPSKNTTGSKKPKSFSMDVYGYVDKISFYSDEARTKPFKTLYYNE